jgi:hypothetical protein
MLDPRLQYTQLHTRQQELADQAARDRLAVSQRVNQKAIGGLLTAAGTALLALGVRLRDQQVSASPHLADAAPSSGERLSASNGNSAKWEIVRQQDGSAAGASTRVAVKKPPTP